MTGDKMIGARKVGGDPRTSVVLGTGYGTAVRSIYCSSWEVIIIVALVIIDIHDYSCMSMEYYCILGKYHTPYGRPLPHDLSTNPRRYSVHIDESTDSPYLTIQ